MKMVCVYCGSNPGRLPEYREAARLLGYEMADRGLGLVYGGASIGVMGAVAGVYDPVFWPNVTPGKVLTCCFRASVPGQRCY